MDQLKRQRQKWKFMLGKRRLSLLMQAMVSGSISSGWLLVTVEM
jgi:hypothetical protein